MKQCKRREFRQAQGAAPELPYASASPRVDRGETASFTGTTERLELLEGKLSRAVLRGQDGGNAVLLPGRGGGNVTLLPDSIHNKELACREIESATTVLYLVLHPSCFDGLIPPCEGDSTYQIRMDGVLGCGMDSRVFRVDPPAGACWFDVDYPDVIELRRQLYPERAGYHMIGSSLADVGWLHQILTDYPALIIAEGVMMYLPEDVVKPLLRRLTDHFPSGQMAFDAFNRLAW